MDFLSFLSQASEQRFWLQRRRFCFVSEAYPLTFFNILFKKLEQKNILPAPYQRIFLESTEKKLLQATLQQSILGSYSFFWLGSLSEERESKSLQELAATLLAYQGPHTVAYFIESDSKLMPKKADDIIQLQTDLNIESFITLVQFFDITFDAKKMSLIRTLFNHNNTISLDVCWMLINYLELISSKYIEDYTIYLANLVGRAPSLSVLSEHFFSKNSQQFFALWPKIQKEYPDMFWIIFWAEQMWKAHYVTSFLHAKDFVQAKRMSFRLPYSFINRDWKKSSSKEFAQAYTFLYHMDYALKTGSSFCSLDLFYMNYFMGKFA